MVSATHASASDDQRTRKRLSSPATVVGIAVLAMAIVAFAAYAIGASNGNRLKVLSGDAYVGAHQAGMTVDGWSYGVVDSVAWVDAAGASHDSGWPDCLGTPGTTVRVRFGEIAVTGPNDDSWREVAWIDCRGAALIR